MSQPTKTYIEEEKKGYNNNCIMIEVEENKREEEKEEYKVANARIEIFLPRRIKGCGWFSL